MNEIDHDLLAFHLSQLCGVSGCFLPTRSSLLLVVLILAAFILAGCEKGPRHPPRFSDFKKVGSDVLDDPKKIESQVALFEAAAFAKKELDKIRSRGDAVELIGAGTQTHLRDETGVQLLDLATRNAPNNAIAWAASAYRHASLLSNNIELTNNLHGLELAIDGWSRCQPKNSAPVYLRAWLKSRAEDSTGAKQLMAVASDKPQFDTLERDVRRAVRTAAEAVDYPKYTACMMSVGQAPGIVPWSTLVKGLLSDRGGDEEIAKQCLLFGRRLETQAQAGTFLDELVALNIQTRALAQLNQQDSVKEIQRISDRKAFIKKATTFLQSSEAHKASESQWLAYFDLLFTTSEGQAVLKLASDLHHKL